MSDADFQPTRWWRVTDDLGVLRMETSNEQEARADTRSGYRLFRLYRMNTDLWLEVVENDS